MLHPSCCWDIKFQPQSWSYASSIVPLPDSVKDEWILKQHVAAPTPTCCCWPFVEHPPSRNTDSNPAGTRKKWNRLQSGQAIGSTRPAVTVGPRLGTTIRVRWTKVDGLENGTPGHAKPVALTGASQHPAIAWKRKKGKHHPRGGF